MIAPARDHRAMSEDCIFCGIVAGEIPSYEVYEDGDVYAFLDANPLARGHTLVIPKSHHERVADLPDDAGDALFSAIRRLAPAVQEAMDAGGATIGMNDGAPAGQEIPHVHGHVVPRTEDDGAGAIHSLRWPRPDLDDGEFEDVVAAIRQARR